MRSGETRFRGRRLVAIIICCFVATSSQKIFSNVGCPSHSFLPNELYLSGGLNAARAKLFRAESFFEYPKMLFWLRIIPKVLTGTFTQGYLLRASGLFDLATVMAGDKVQLGIKLPTQTSYTVLNPDVADKELLVMITAPINFDDTSGRLTTHVADLTSLSKVSSSAPSNEEIALLNVTFRASALTLPQGSYSAFYDGAKDVGLRTSELRLGAGNNVCPAPPCTIGDYRGAVREFRVLPFVVLNDEDFSISFADQTWSLDGSRVNKEFVYYTVLSQLPGGMDCITTARSTGA